VGTPTLLVWGRDDAITPLNSGEIYERAIPRARLVTVPNCGHMPEMEKPAEFAELVRSLATRISHRTSPNCTPALQANQT
jgi:pimeloyl-ACP methyl ester carboxylesterase